MAEEMKVSDIGTVAISLGVAIIVLVVISLLVQDLRDDTSLVPDNTASFGNQSLTWGGNDTAISFSVPRVLESTIVLYSNGTVVNKGDNYTTTDSSITPTNQSPQGLEWVTDGLNVSYDYFFGSAARNISNRGLESQNTLSSFLPLVALTAAGALVIGIVIRFFLRRRED